MTHRPKEVIVQSSRRQFLKVSGAASLLLLPIFRSSRAFAATTAAPKRLVFFHSPLGSVRDNYLCSGSTTSLTLSPILQPLSAYKKNLLVMDGLDYLPDNSGNLHNHHEAGAMLTGRCCDGQDGTSKHSNISIDQFIHGKLPASVPIKSLPLMTFYRQETLNADRNLFSARGPNLPVIPEGDPQAAFDRVFAGFNGGGGGGAPDPAMEALRLKRKSVLDAVTKELSNLQTQMSGPERAKLDQHTSAIRDLEATLQAPAQSGMCTVPGRPAKVNPYDNNTIPARLKAHMQVVAAAMACDLIRVAVIGSENGQGRASPTWLGYNSNWHDAYTHDNSGHEQHTNIHNWYAQQFAYMVGLFNAVTEADGTMLDNSALVFFSEQGTRYLGAGDNAHGDPNMHGRKDLPFVVAGSCGGYFKQNALIELGGGVSYKSFLFNCLRAMGYSDTSMGAVSGSPISALAA